MTDSVKAERQAAGIGIQRHKLEESLNSSRVFGEEHFDVGILPRKLRQSIFDTEILERRPANL
jgi:hypothetical protein